MTPEELKALADKVGKEAAQVIETKMAEAQKALDEKLAITSKSTATKEEILVSEAKLTESLK